MKSFLENDTNKKFSKNFENGNKKFWEGKNGLKWRKELSFFYGWTTKINQWINSESFFLTHLKDELRNNHKIKFNSEETKVIVETVTLFLSFE